MPANTPRGYTYPLLSDTQNFPAQIQDLAQDIDLDVESLDNAIQAAYNRDSVRVTGPIGGTQAIASGAGGASITYSTEVYDNNGMANLGVLNDRITFQTQGIYLITAHVRWDVGPNATWGAVVALTSTGSTVAQPALMSRQGHNTRQTDMTITAPHFASVGNTMRVVAAQVSGVAVNVINASLTVTLLS